MSISEVDTSPSVAPAPAPAAASAPAPAAAASPATAPAASPGTASFAAATVQTPDGDFSVVLSTAAVSSTAAVPSDAAVASTAAVPSTAAVLASGWTADVASLVALIHPSLRPSLDEVVFADPAGIESGATGSPLLDDALAAIAAYYDGDLEAPGRVPVRQVSGEFRMHAWEVLREVEPGAPITYAEYAARSGRPAAVRAAAGACALNAAALFVPCHRVLRTDGSLGGFRYGLAIKERLLARETAERS